MIRLTQSRTAAVRPAASRRAVLFGVMLLSAPVAHPVAAAGPVLAPAAARPVALRAVAVLDRDALRRAGIRRPERMAYGADGTLYVLDGETRRVVGLDANGRERSSSGGYGDDETSLVLPVDLAIDRRGSLLVLDRGRGAVVAYDAAGRFLASRALEGVAADEARAPGVRLIRDSFGDLWLLGPLARDLIPLGERLAPSRLSRYLEPADSLSAPALAAILPSGGTWVYDAGGSSLRQYHPGGRHARSVDLAAVESGPLLPADIAADPSGVLWVADPRGQRLVAIDASGEPVLERVFGGPSAPWRPTALALGPGDRLAAADGEKGEIQLLLVEREAAP